MVSDLILMTKIIITGRNTHRWLVVSNKNIAENLNYMLANFSNDIWRTVTLGQNSTYCIILGLESY